MSTEELRGEIARHRAEAERYYAQAARFGGELGANARSYAALHAAKARELECDCAAKATGSEA